MHEVGANWKMYADNYMEGYHVPLVHPELNREIVAKEYRVEVGRPLLRALRAGTRDGAVNAGRWLWRYPNLALNVYPDGMNVERVRARRPRHTLVLYDYFFRDLDARAANEEVVRVGCTISRGGPGDLRGGAAQLDVGRLRHRPAEPTPRERRRGLPRLVHGVARRGARQPDTRVRARVPFAA